MQIIPLYIVVSVYFLLCYFGSFHSYYFFFFNDTATTEIYTLSLHDALPIWPGGARRVHDAHQVPRLQCCGRSEEHTSELQSRGHLVCRLLLEKKKINISIFVQ